MSSILCHHSRSSGIHAAHLYFCQAVFCRNFGHQRNRSLGKNSQVKMTKLQHHFMQKLEEKFSNRAEKRVQPRGIRLSRGTPPSLLAEIDEGPPLRKRQRVLDKIFMENITQILAVNPIGEVFREMDAVITQVEVTKDYHTLHVYYHCDINKIKEVATELTKIKGKLHIHLVEKYIMGKVPSIEFVFDNSHNLFSDLEKRLKEADFGPEHEPKDFDEYTPPKPDPPPEELNPNMAKHIWSLTSFDPDFASRYDENPYEKKPLPPVPKFECPEDMNLNVFNLDYKHIVQKVLFHLYKSRCNSKSYNSNPNAFPPVDWSSIKPMPRAQPDMNDPAQHFKQRVLLMKKFMVENRKKKLILAREAKKAKDLYRIQIADALADVKDKLGVTDFYEEEDGPVDDYYYDPHDQSDLDLSKQMEEMNSYVEMDETASSQNVSVNETKFE